MNERQARDAGYSFTGHYSRNKEEAKEYAKELRSNGNKAIVVETRSRTRSGSTLLDIRCTGSNQKPSKKLNAKKHFIKK
jgi:predicted HAD superfamily phosphohydrolase YqeG